MYGKAICMYLECRHREPALMHTAPHCVDKFTKARPNLMNCKKFANFEILQTFHDCLFHGALLTKSGSTLHVRRLPMQCYLIMK